MSVLPFTIGCDPEIFVRKNGKPYSAYGLIPGTKESPYKTARGAIQVDGMALELNTDPVSYSDFEGFNQNIVHTIDELRRECLKKDKIKFAIEPVQDFGKEFIDAQPDQAKELGCDPDYNAYTLEPNPRPDGDRPFRTGAGHIHIGWGADIPIDNPDHIAICAGFVKMLDATVGMYMTCIDRDPRRRELYGKAGAFRPKSYGVEYRTPSNVWIRNRDRRFMMQKMIAKAINLHSQGREPIDVCGYREEEIVTIINTGNYAMSYGAMMRMVGYSNLRNLFGNIWDSVEKERRNG